VDEMDLDYRGKKTLVCSKPLNTPFMLFANLYFLTKATSVHKNYLHDESRKIGEAACAHRLVAIRNDDDSDGVQYP
jgi:hypothetical protein